MSDVRILKENIKTEWRKSEKLYWNIFQILEQI